MTDNIYRKLARNVARIITLIPFNFSRFIEILKEECVFCLKERHGKNSSKISSVSNINRKQVSSIFEMKRPHIKTNVNSVFLNDLETYCLKNECYVVPLNNVKEFAKNKPVTEKSLISNAIETGRFEKLDNGDLKLLSLKPVLAGSVLNTINAILFFDSNNQKAGLTNLYNDEDLENLYHNAFHTSLIDPIYSTDVENIIRKNLRIAMSSIEHEIEPYIDYSSNMVHPMMGVMMTQINHNRGKIK